MIDIEQCNDNNCESEENIEEFFEKNQMILLFNTMEYQPEVYTDETIFKVARFET